MTQSAAIQDSSLATWIYFDALNPGTPQEEYRVNAPLENVFDEFGNPITEKYDGSRYLRWDHTLGKMVVDMELGELNSDRGVTIQAFLEYALADCVARGTEEYFLVSFLNSLYCAHPLGSHH